MRTLIIAATALGAAVAAAPAAAQPYPDPRSYPDPRDEEIARAIPPAGDIEAVGETVARVADALMDVDVGPVVDAIDPEGRSYRRDRTLGEIASRDDPYARERMRDEIAGASVGVAAMAQELAVLAPVLRRSLEDAAHRMEDAIEDARARRYDRRD